MCSLLRNKTYVLAQPTSLPSAGCTCHFGPPRFLFPLSSDLSFLVSSLPPTMLGQEISSGACTVFFVFFFKYESKANILKEILHENLDFKVLLHTKELATFSPYFHIITSLWATWQQHLWRGQGSSVSPPWGWAGGYVSPGLVDASLAQGAPASCPLL